MQNALLVGLSRQVALSRKLDVIANNIANINTTGFKSDGSVFEEFVDKTARGGNFIGRDNQVSFVRDRATWVDMTQGTMVRTGNPTDVAIDGKGFLAVQTPAGERYTRNGALQINAKGQLVTSEGNPVLGTSGPITFQANDRNIRISPDGTISVREGDDAKNESQRGTLRIVGIANPGVLQKDGGSNFSLPAGVTVAADTTSRLVQGSIEKSNVHGVLEMTRLIDVTRSYTEVSNILAQQADMQRGSIDKLAEVPN
jgi:flagellar basal-body rod protein FlgF